MKYQFHKAVVIGAGTMGGGIAALLANTGVRVTLLDIVPNKLTPEEEKQGLTTAEPETLLKLPLADNERLPISPGCPLLSYGQRRWTSAPAAPGDANRLIARHKRRRSGGCIFFSYSVQRLRARPAPARAP